MPRLALFDLDGTLAATTAVDAECYVQAFEDILGHELHTDWAAYEHCTDWGIARQALNDHFGRPPDNDDLAPVRRRFRELLEERLARDPEAFREIPGAGRLLAHLAESGWHLAIATGGWGVSAELKRRAAGLPAGIPILSSDHHWSREEIVRAAIERAHEGGSRPCRAGGRPGADGAALDEAGAGSEAADGPGTAGGGTVTVGDGVCDVRTARRLGLPFVGVGRGEHRRRLVQAGARAVLPDFADLPAALEAVENARPPRPSSASG